MRLPFAGANASPWIPIAPQYMQCPLPSGSTLSQYIPTLLLQWSWVAQLGFTMSTRMALTASTCKSTSAIAPQAKLTFTLESSSFISSPAISMSDTPFFRMNALTIFSFGSQWYPCCSTSTSGGMTRITSRPGTLIAAFSCDSCTLMRKTTSSFSSSDPPTSTVSAFSPHSSLPTLARKPPPWYWSHSSSWGPIALT